MFEWQLLANGLSLVADVTGLYSFAKGFAVDKNTQRLTDSLVRLEELQEQLLHEFSSNNNALQQLSPIISQFVSRQSHLDRQHLQFVFAQVGQQITQEIANHTRDLLAEVQTEMKAIIDSVRVSHGPPNQVSPHLFKAISHDPFAAGMTRVWDITSGGLYTIQQPTIVTSQFAPISWADQRSQRAYLGEMPVSLLDRYGLTVRPPQYRNAVDGHIFSERYGLYVPAAYHFGSIHV